MEFVLLLTVAHVRVDGLAPRVLLLFVLKVVSMELVLPLIIVPVILDGMEQTVILLFAPLFPVRMEDIVLNPMFVVVKEQVIR